MKTLASIMLFALCASIAGAQPKVGGPPAGTVDGNREMATRDFKWTDVGIDQKLDQQVPADLTFVDEKGTTVQLGQYYGDKPVVLALVYYACPMLCTQVLNGLTASLKMVPLEPGKEYTVLAVSFDPKDTPELAGEKKKNYMETLGQPGAPDAWHFLTGKEDQIKRLTDAVGFRYVFDEKTQQYAHAAGVMVLTPHGKLARYFYGIEYKPKDLRLGLVEASNNKIGSPVDQVLLMCFHYDPLTGKYAVATLALIRIAGAITVLLLAGFIFVMVRRELKQRAAAAAASGTESGA